MYLPTKSTKKLKAIAKSLLCYPKSIVPYWMPTILVSSLVHWRTFNFIAMFGPSLGIVETIFLCYVWHSFYVQWPNARSCPQWITYPCFWIWLFSFMSHKYWCHLILSLFSILYFSLFSCMSHKTTCRIYYSKLSHSNSLSWKVWCDNETIAFVNISRGLEVYFALCAYNLSDHDARTHAHIETLWEEMYGHTILLTHQTPFIYMHV